MSPSYTPLAALGAFIALLSCATAAPFSPISSLLFHSPYAPHPARCPSNLLRTAAQSLSPEEAAWIQQRKPKAERALGAWIDGLNAGFDTSSLPTIGLTSSGGGFRATLTAAGFVQAMDSRDSSTGLSGLYQGLTYHAGLSGGSWLVSSMAANDWPTISTLSTEIWRAPLRSGLLSGNQPIPPATHARILYDIESKKKAGYRVSLTDVWGRLLSLILLRGTDGDVSGTFADISTMTSFMSHQVPFPLITTLNVDTAANLCTPSPNAIQFEITPYEFGSWAHHVNGFTPTKYLGSSLSHGHPTHTRSGQECTTGFDNLGFMFGTSSSLFNEECANSAEFQIPNSVKDIMNIISMREGPGYEYAEYPNPFHHSPVIGTGPDISKVTTLTLVDGGESMQNNPIWPMIQPARHIDVLIVNDNTGRNKRHLPDAIDLYNTYTQAQKAGLIKMPSVPGTEYFRARNGRPTFLGCHNTQQMTLIYVPNHPWTFPSNQSTFKMLYTETESVGMIANGQKVATYNDHKDWPTCLACGIMHKMESKLPSACRDCLRKYCHG